MSTTPTPLPPAGIRVEPDMDVEIVRPVFVDGEETKPGDVVTVDGNTGHILIGEGMAKKVEPPPPVEPPVTRSAKT